MDEAQEFLLGLVCRKRVVGMTAHDNPHVPQFEWEVYLPSIGNLIWKHEQMLKCW